MMTRSNAMSEMSEAGRNYLPHLIRTSAIVCLAAAGLLSLDACTAIRVKLGMRVYLAKTQVASIKVTLPGGPGIAPGEKSPLVVVVTEPNGKVLQTEGQGHGKVLWTDLKVTATVATADLKGNVSLPHDPRKSEGQLPHITVTVPSHPGITADLDIPVRYNYAYVSNFSGSPGADGADGMDGSDGSSGSDGSIDPSNASPGGDGGDGGNGGNGGNGGPGGDAPNVQVQVALSAGPPPLLQVAVTAPGHRRLYLIDPQGGSITVKADGGAGGAGGRAGSGGSGGMGGSGSPPGSNGTNGQPGAAGNDGPQGKGGLITVTYDPQVQPYMGLIHLSSQNGPKPVINEAPVAPLW
jgi:hypothetical protein